jgi:hypothetical protein
MSPCRPAVATRSDSRGHWTLYCPSAIAVWSFGDEIDPIAETVILKYLAFNVDGNAALVAHPTASPAASIVRIGTDPLLLMYRTAETLERAAGTYVFGAVPF